MPFVLHPRVRKGFARLAAVTTVGFFASTGLAAACTTPATSTPFASLGDTSSYFVVPGGNFENTGSGWNFSNAAITAGNEPFQIGGAGDSQSLTINAGGSATSPTLCVDSTMPSFRFFAHEATPGSDLAVQVYWKTNTGSMNNLNNSSNTQVADLSDGTLTQWAATGSLNLAGLLNLNPYQSYSVQLRFSVPQSGSWQIDDVYVDPYRTA